ncbi:hypothetical protein N0V83_002239 [Neocucurbitaria cava]|uniref:Uncharacterized protein n=1 Tax=Neocucurbitaria cava TaxID=798079 RepID=A0A9W9CPV7_9PLEO|nr:hypothetical protein N0V83_002239 [Neocucurbitaria cava]
MDARLPSAEIKNQPSDQPHDDQVSIQEGHEVYQINPAEEKRLLRKLDLTFNLIFMLVYLTCFLDRGNIGNVRVAGIIPDIHTNATAYGAAISVFYATYILVEIPIPLLMKRLTPCVLLSALCAAISGAFGGLLAYGLLQMDGISGYAGWRWVYIIEGIISIAVVPLIWFGLPNNPSQAYFLNAHQKEIMVARDIERARYIGQEKFDWGQVNQAFRDPKVYLSGIIQFCQDILLYGFSTFLPSILTSMGYDKLEANYLSIPVYIWGALAFVGVARISDKYKVRGIVILGTNLVGIVGYILLLTIDTGGVRYFATFLCVTAVYVGPGLNLAWLNVNSAPQYKRATAIGIQQSMGNSAGIVAGQVYRTAPYTLGNAFSLGSLCVAEIMIIVLVLYLKRQNSMKQRSISGSVRERGKSDTGDGAVDFVYHL